MTEQVLTFTGGTDPAPYLCFAYALGFIAIIGFALYLLQQRRRLQQLLENLEGE